MAEAEDYHPLHSKRKAITALLPHAVRQERDGQPEMLNAFLHAVRASKNEDFMWRHVEQYAGRLLHEASPRAIALVLPYTPRYWQIGREESIQQWAAAASAVIDSEEVAQDVIDTLLQIASHSELLSHIPTDTWSWLTKRPSLPPVCRGRSVGTRDHIVKAVRALDDIEILKSYFLLTWSEWDTLSDEGFNDICASIREDFCGIEMDRHRADLTQRLDHILGQLDRGLEYLKQHSPGLGERDIQVMTQQYGKLKTLLEV